MNKFESLAQNGWKHHTSSPYQEAVSKEANNCYTFTNSKNTEIGLLTYADNSSVRIRLAGTRGNNFNYFEIPLKGNEEAVVNKINAVKDEADINNYFGLYFSLQEVGEASILAWEQWEKNYR